MILNTLTGFVFRYTVFVSFRPGHHCFVFAIRFRLFVFTSRVKDMIKETKCRSGMTWGSVTDITDTFRRVLTGRRKT